MKSELSKSNQQEFLQFFPLSFASQYLRTKHSLPETDNRTANWTNHMSEGTANDHPKPTNTSSNKIVYCSHFNSHLHIFEWVAQSWHHELVRHILLYHGLDHEGGRNLSLGVLCMISFPNSNGFTACSTFGNLLSFSVTRWLWMWHRPYPRLAQTS